MTLREIKALSPVTTKEEGTASIAYSEHLLTATPQN